ncbi:hypothetical protein BDV95DRAFT_331837 [Massariosphaeria phaeospora]|uniref:Uncharacterized protein n=1 Tax=Massariosphaeria phaeospora TaxID=100035 RepID=A0A7C8MFZ1_9PLEO|nr:hypothetical protein BDV95DRAFT_331837 [Massariosphaeria phaeospora]
MTTRHYLQSAAILLDRTQTHNHLLTTTHTPTTMADPLSSSTTLSPIMTPMAPPRLPTTTSLPNTPSPNQSWLILTCAPRNPTPLHDTAKSESEPDTMGTESDRTPRISTTNLLSTTISATSSAATASTPSSSPTRLSDSPPSTPPTSTQASSPSPPQKPGLHSKHLTRLLFTLLNLTRAAYAQPHAYPKRRFAITHEYYLMLDAFARFFAKPHVRSCDFLADGTYACVLMLQTLVQLLEQALGLRGGWQRVQHVEIAWPQCAGAMREGEEDSLRSVVCANVEELIWGDAELEEVPAMGTRQGT